MENDIPSKWNLEQAGRAILHSYLTKQMSSQRIKDKEGYFI
jgi:hypothetical protein